MPARQLVTFLLGAWIAGSLFMMIVATQNFRNVDRLLAAPSTPAAGMIAALGHDSARQLLRYHSSELNRLYFRWWEAAQLGIGAGLLITFVRSKIAGKPLIFMAAAMVVITASMHWWLTPQIVEIGRAIDFVPQTADSAERTQFWRLHGIYSTLEVIKLAALVISGLFLFRKDAPTAGRIRG